MIRNLYPIIFSVFLLISLLTNPFWAFAEEDACAEKGILVKNMTTFNLWSRVDQGACYIYQKNKFVRVLPGEKIGIFSDLVCLTSHCDDFTYEKFLSSDGNGDCRVRINPGCEVSDL